MQLASPMERSLFKWQVFLQIKGSLVRESICRAEEFSVYSLLTIKSGQQG
jgi:hypothetical protein